MTPIPSFDPRVVLSMNLATQPGVYAVLLGSGVSTAAGIPTGWGVVESLVRRVAVASQNPIGEEGWEQWWSDNYPHLELGYSSVLELLGPTPAARKALLSQFFEASEDDRADGRKVPTPAHHAIAALVAKGTIRVMVTTNFDRLLEHALDAAGVNYQVASAEASIVGMEPLSHASATIFKVNGDFVSLDQRNTVDELSSYTDEARALLARIVDEYGLVISGWSGDWDRALLEQLERRSSRRYGLVWTTWRTAGAIASRLTSSRGDILMENVAADEFFTDLLQRVEALEMMAEVPASLAVKVGRLRRSLPDPTRHLEVRALFEHELKHLREWSSARPTTARGIDERGARDEVSSIKREFSSLIQLFTQGIMLDRNRDHTELWVWVLQQAMNARQVAQTGARTAWWESLLHLPAVMLLRAGVLAALEAKHEDVIIRLCLEPTWASAVLQRGEPLPAHRVLHVHDVLPSDPWREILQVTDQTGYNWPASQMLREELQPLAAQLFGDDAAEAALGRMEYRLEVAGLLLRPGARIAYRSPAAGLYVLFEHNRPDDSVLPLTTDFLQRGDVEAWKRGAVPPLEDEAFEQLITSMDERLQTLRDQAF